ncbi:hypothetical protein NPIL_400071 [Nephila pilipes]|uniref:Uncharacterized protein n=1 Tax=Nephila pilipes TaxID=299642 RepID=A0A8X6PZ86_NEPPI|nr:hypothetical protein NPIL_400071 [Nephila pilipes]
MALECSANEGKELFIIRSTKLLKRTNEVIHKFMPRLQRLLNGTRPIHQHMHLNPHWSEDENKQILETEISSQNKCCTIKMSMKPNILRIEGKNKLQKIQNETKKYYYDKNSNKVNNCVMSDLATIKKNTHILLKTGLQHFWS